VDRQLGRLYTDYARTIRALDIALTDRKRRRPAPAAQAPIKTPVGAPSSYAAPAAPPQARPGARPEMRIFLGPILGWAKVIGNWESYREPADPTAWFRASSLYDEITDTHLQRTMNEYLAARQAFFDYVRKLDVASHYAAAKELLNSAATDQFFGIDEASQAKIEDAKAEVSAALELELKQYRATPAPRSDESTKRFIGAVAAAQLVGAYESPAYKESETELERILEVESEGPGASEESLTQRRKEIRRRAGRAVDAYKAEPEPKTLTAKMTLVDTLAEVRVALPKTDALRRNLEALLLQLLGGSDPHLQW
jgi:hypothetical protein